jgi:uncharacterized lipoprotein YmbA
MTRLALLLPLALAACAELTPARLHLLPPPPPAAAESDALERQLIGVNYLMLPQYAEDAEIARVLESGAVGQAPDDLWADPLPRAGALALAAALERRTGAAVMVEPFPLEAAPTLRVEVVADRFLADRDGDTALTGAYRVSDLRANGLAIHRRFELAAAAPEPSWSGLAAAHSAALGALADDLAAALIERYGR